MFGISIMELRHYILLLLLLTTHFYAAKEIRTTKISYKHSAKILKLLIEEIKRLYKQILDYPEVLKSWNRDKRTNYFRLVQYIVNEDDTNKISLYFQKKDATGFINKLKMPKKRIGSVVAAAEKQL